MRVVQCLQTQLETRTSHPVHNSSCVHLPHRPPELVDCEQPACERYSWKYSQWREVSETHCAVGARLRLQPTTSLHLNI